MGFRVFQGFCRVQGLEFRVKGPMCLALELGFRVSGLRFRVPCFGRSLQSQRLVDIGQNIIGDFDTIQR